MRQNMHARRTKYIISTCFICLLLLVSGTILVLSFHEDAAVIPTLGQIVGEKAKEAAAFSSFSLVAEESGPGYSLRFTGQMERNIIYGRIETYDLEVCSANNNNYVKDGEMYQEWVEADKAGLEELAAFIRNPLFLLNALLSGREVLVEEGPPRLVEDIPCQTYFLEIPPPDIQMFSRFKDDAILEKLQIYLWFAEETGFLHRMAVMLQVSAGGESTQLNRIYTMSPRVKELPEGLPIKPEVVRI